MACEGRAAREGLLAIRIRALVWPFAGVDPPMASKRAGVAEGLERCQRTSIQAVSSLVYLATSFTHVRLLASMHACVHGQRRPLDELLVAIREVADVRADTAMYPFYVAQSAHIKCKTILVSHTMPRKVTTPCKAFGASRACERLRQTCAARPSFVATLILLLHQVLYRSHLCLRLLLIRCIRADIGVIRVLDHGHVTRLLHWRGIPLNAVQ